MDSLITQVTCIVGALAVLAFGAAAWMKKRTLYMPANADTSQPVDYNAEKKREDKARAKGAVMVWTVFIFACILLYAYAFLSPSIKKVSAALAPSTSTSTITQTPTITHTPRETSTPRPTWTPPAGAASLSAPTGSGGSLLDTILTPVNTHAPQSPQSPQTVNVVVVHTKIVKVEQTRIVRVRETVVTNMLVTFPVPVTVIVTVIVTPTYTLTPSPTMIETSTETPTLTPTASLTITPSPTGITSYP